MEDNSKRAETAPVVNLPTNAADADKDKRDRTSIEERSIQHGENDLLSGEMVDEVLAAKMTLVNNVSGRTFP